LEKEQWEAIKKKDPAYDQSFVYVNRKTGIICRPSCKKKEISPKNIIIFDTVEEAVDAGYRPCKLCHPDRDCWKGARQELTEMACRILEKNYLQPYSLDSLAESLHINKHYLLRTFRMIMDETPLQYHNRYRCEKAKELLRKPELSVFYIAMETGYNSASHFSRVFDRIEGCTPSEYRKRYLEGLEENPDAQKEICQEQEKDPEDPERTARS